MRILLVSNYWPEYRSGGIGSAATIHVEALRKLGHVVARVGTGDIADPSGGDYFKIFGEGLRVFYSKSCVARTQVSQLLLQWKPDVVFVEGWQFAFQEEFIDASIEAGIDLVIVSHGVSIKPDSLSLRSLVKSLAWLPYAHVRLPRAIARSAAFTTLSESSQSARFADRDIAKRIGKRVYLLPNSTSLESKEPSAGLPHRKIRIGVCGYFGAVKNQLLAIRVAQSVMAAQHNVEFYFLGSLVGQYFGKCRQKVEQLNLGHSINFIDSKTMSGADFAELIDFTLVTSMTEAQPVWLLETMAVGRPFVSTPVGAIPEMEGGLLGRDESELSRQLLELIRNPARARNLREAGRRMVEDRFRASNTEKTLSELLEDLSSNLSSRSRKWQT